MTVDSLTNGMKRLVKCHFLRHPRVGGVGIGIENSFIPRLIRAYGIPSRVHEVLQYSLYSFFGGRGEGGGVCVMHDFFFHGVAWLCAKVAPTFKLTLHP